MSDLIDRQAAINNIKNGFHWETVNGIMAQAVLKQVIHDIEIMPSAQPEQRWIPCSERLPEEAGTYICTCTDGKRLIVTAIKWQPRMVSWLLSGARSYWKVLAWMPLPEPYRAERRTDE